MNFSPARILEGLPIRSRKSKQWSSVVTKTDSFLIETNLMKQNEAFRLFSHFVDDLVFVHWEDFFYDMKSWIWYSNIYSTKDIHGAVSNRSIAAGVLEIDWFESVWHKRVYFHSLHDSTVTRRFSVEYYSEKKNIGQISKSFTGSKSSDPSKFMIQWIKSNDIYFVLCSVSFRRQQKN